MSDLVAITFDDALSADKARVKLLEMQKEYLISMDDVVVVTKNAKGKVKLHQALNLTTAGAAHGSFWGLLIGILFLDPLLGVAVGAGAGAVRGALSDYGIDDKSMKNLGKKLPAGGSALFVLVREVTVDKVLDGLKGMGGTVANTSLSKESEEKLQLALAGEPQ